MGALGLLAIGLTTHLAKEGVRPAARAAIYWASKRFPKRTRLRIRDAWLADFDTVDNDLSRLSCAFGALKTSFIEIPPFYMRLRRAIVRLHVLSAVTNMHNLVWLTAVAEGLGPRMTRFSNWAMKNQLRSAIRSNYYVAKLIMNRSRELELCNRSRYFIRCYTKLFKGYRKEVSMLLAITERITSEDRLEKAADPRCGVA